MTEILVITVTYNGAKWIEKCIESVKASSTGAHMLVVDNASTDGTADFVKEKYPEVFLIENQENKGFAEANNQGFRFALEKNYRCVYLLNQDAWVFPETFSALLRVMDASGGKIGIASPMQMDAGMSRMDSQFKKHCAGLLSKDPGESVKVPFVMAAHWMVTRTCLERVGGFSPSFPHYGEDNDYIHRAEYHGFDTVVVKTASAVHDRSARKRPKSYRMDLKVINAKVAVADPRRSPFWSKRGQTLKLFFMGCLHFSTIPWKGIKSLKADYPSLKATRKTARAGAAFL